MKFMMLILAFLFSAGSCAQNNANSYAQANGKNIVLAPSKIITFDASASGHHIHTCIAEVRNNEIPDANRLSNKIKVFQAGKTPYNISTHQPFEIDSSSAFSIKNMDSLESVDIACINTNLAQNNYSIDQNQLAILTPGALYEVSLQIPTSSRSFVVCYHYKELESGESSYPLYYEYCSNNVCNQETTAIIEKVNLRVYGQYNNNTGNSLFQRVYFLNLDVKQHYVYCFTRTFS